ncbi:MAG: membrane protein [Sulfurovum sp. PC08-66]|nr:MAG: membrane protein [Sulfurovum sp. PC08-66]KIM12639.1 MAG: membrane protein [Sulfuricurvum sp. PC08-66]
MLNKEIVAFLVAGGVAATVNFLSRFGYDYFFDFGTAVLLAYITGMITAFVLNKYFVFAESVHSTFKEALYFVLVNLVAVLQTYLISIWLVLYTLPMIAHGVGIVVPVFTSYLGHKFFSFRGKNVSK